MVLGALLNSAGVRAGVLRCVGEGGGGGRKRLIGELASSVRGASGEGGVSKPGGWQGICTGGKGSLAAI